MEVNWSRWFRCESSFELLLVPNQPGILALAEEVTQPTGPNSRRMLAVIKLEEADDLAREMSRLFAIGSPWRERLTESRYYVRFAVAPELADRQAAVSALKNWLNSQREVASQVFERSTIARLSRYAHSASADDAWFTAQSAESDASELKTIAEQAVDRVTRGIRLSKNVSVVM